MTQWLFIQAQDVWMFRTAKPFTAGEGFLAKSLFPTPQTMQGVIRSHIIEHSGVSFAEYNAGNTDEARKLIEKIGDAGNLGQLQLQGPFVARRSNSKVERVHPLPLDVLGGHILAPGIKDFETDDPVVGWKPLKTKGNQEITLEKKSDDSMWLDDTKLQAYLKGAGFTPIEEKELFQRETHVGIGMDHGRRTTRESQFYHAEFIRPQPEVGLLVGIPDDLAPYFEKSRIMNIGGEGRSAYYENAQYTPLKNQATSGKIKIILLSPAYFSGGWQPENGAWSPWVGKGSTLVSAAIDKPLAISGWDMVKKAPKPLYHYVPAGSVYFFENATLTGANAFTETPNKALDHPALGFGAFIATTW